jgi:UDP-N-acetylenolpyruvoylglucosamine reductase
VILRTDSRPSITRSSLLSPLTTLRVGGPADLAAPRSADEVRLLLEWCAETQTPWRVLGRGSNLLVSDEGVPGVVLHTRAMNWMTFGDRGGGREGDDVEVTAGAGLRTSVLLGRTRERGLGGLECLVGYPATVGGAARMNAGGRWGSTGERIEKVRAVGPGGALREMSVEECRFAYRSSALADHVVVEVVLRLPRVDVVAYRRRIEEIHREKAATQPLDAHSAGCVFKNPPGASAGRLVDECGLKGARVGGAEVSRVHGNFIVNAGGATAADVLELIDRVREAVLRRAGVLLELEVEVWGETPVPARV